MLGTGKSRKSGDFGLLGRIGKKFGYEVQAEWMRIDQAWYHILRQPEIMKEELRRTDALIEHVNNANIFASGLQKLGEVSCPLKVGIFHPAKTTKYNQ